MSLSALVNSPPKPTAPFISSPASHDPRQTSYTPAQPSAQSQYPYASGSRYVSPLADRHTSQSHAYSATTSRAYSRTHSLDSFHSPSPTRSVPTHPASVNQLVSSGPATRILGKSDRRVVIPDARLSGSEDAWEKALRSYQKQREAEASEISQLDLKEVNDSHCTRFCH